jgi:pSer/pThr/pTyr-binding forkhead associated (FHA) protein
MTSESVDWLLLFLRLLFVIVLYFFLFQIVRLTARELTILAQQDTSPQYQPRATGRLVVIDPAEASLPLGMEFALARFALIGRHPECSIVLDDTFVSGEHAELAATGDGWQVRDLASTNGTFVNGQEVFATAHVQSGDVVQFGRVKLKLVC